LSAQRRSSGPAARLEARRVLCESPSTSLVQGACNTMREIILDFVAQHTTR